jgi:aldehyde dehydrogenase family protein
MRSVEQRSGHAADFGGARLAGRQRDRDGQRQYFGGGEDRCRDRDHPGDHAAAGNGDTGLAVATVVASSTVFAGQFCMTGSRILVERAIADEFTQALAGRLESVRPGPASDPASEIGPMIDPASVARVQAAVEAAIAGGAEVIVRGRSPRTTPRPRPASLRGR